MDSGTCRRCGSIVALAALDAGICAMCDLENPAQDPEHENVHRHEDGTEHAHGHDGSDWHRHPLPSLGPAMPRTTGYVVWQASESGPSTTRVTEDPSNVSLGPETSA